MPAQERRVSYPCSISTRGKKGRLIHKHRGAWLNAIVNKRGEKRMYVKINIHGVGEQVVWLNTPVLDAMLQYLVDKTDKSLRGLSPKEKEVLYGASKKERVKRES